MTWITLLITKARGGKLETYFKTEMRPALKAKKEIKTAYDISQKKGVIYSASPNPCRRLFMDFPKRHPSTEITLLVAPSRTSLSTATTAAVPRLVGWGSIR